ncbi:MAG: glycosyltransferase family 4 protein [Gammaproteobacteria bacterium]|nr:glycosyltransferase family 4 protein [Gammaproteobacteria bacterium]
MRLLLVGPMPPPYGGTTVSFSTLVGALQKKLKREDTLDVINTNIGAKNILPLLWKIFSQAKSADVISLHVGNRGALVLSPAVYLAARLFRKKVLTSKFGGRFHDYYEALNPVQQKLLDATFFKSDKLLLETRQLVDYFADKNDHIAWFPTARDIGDDSDIGLSADAPRVVFIGHIRNSKGVLELLAAARELPSMTFDVYGPFYDGLDESLFDVVNVNYKGLLEPEQVIGVLREHDVFLMPTYYPGEGYPGALIEAKIAGLAIITTHWRAIPELIDDGRNGILVEPRRVDQVVGALRELADDPARLLAMKEQSRRSAHDFDLDNWSSALYGFYEALYKTG